MAAIKEEQEFPHSLTIDTPFPTHRHANIALRSLSVDEELSNLVRRDFELVDAISSDHAVDLLAERAEKLRISEEKTILRVYYKATTPRMLRVAVNGFFESLSLIVQVMEELDVDVLHENGIEGLEGVQGVEQGLTGTAVGVGG